MNSARVAELLLSEFREGAVKTNLSYSLEQKVSFSVVGLDVVDERFEKLLVGKHPFSMTLECFSTVIL